MLALPIQIKSQFVETDSSSHLPTVARMSLFKDYYPDEFRISFIIKKMHCHPIAIGSGEGQNLFISHEIPPKSEVFQFFCRG